MAACKLLAIVMERRWLFAAVGHRLGKAKAQTHHDFLGRHIAHKVAEAERRCGGGAVHQSYEIGRLGSGVRHSERAQVGKGAAHHVGAALRDVGNCVERRLHAPGEGIHVHYGQQLPSPVQRAKNNTYSKTNDSYCHHSSRDSVKSRKWRSKASAVRAQAGLVCARRAGQCAAPGRLSGGGAGRAPLQIVADEHIQEVSGRLRQVHEHVGNGARGALPQQLRHEVTPVQVVAAQEGLRAVVRLGVLHHAGVRGRVQVCDESTDTPASRWYGVSYRNTRISNNSIMWLGCGITVAS